MTFDPRAGFTVLDTTGPGERPADRGPTTLFSSHEIDEPALAASSARSRGTPVTIASDIMHAGVTCVSEDDTLAVAAQRMRDLEVGALPIRGTDDRLHGMVTDRDIVVKCIAAGDDPTVMTVKELAQGHACYIDGDADVEEMLSLMEEHQVRRLPVIEEGRLVGIISEADIAQHLQGHEIARFV